MSAPWPGSMRGPRVKTPHLLLLLLLLSSLTGTDAEAGTGEEVATDSEPEGGEDAETSEAISVEPDPTPPADLTPTAESQSTTDFPLHVDESPLLAISTIENEPGSGHTTEAADESDGSGYTDTNTTAEPDEDLNPTIILIPVVLVVVIIGMIVCGIFINRRWNNKARIQELRKEDPYLDGSSTEKVPMPMFEEDVPSVLELEMEELDQWMKKDGGTTEESKHA